jgi:hypothetical protein
LTGQVTVILLVGIVLGQGVTAGADPRSGKHFEITTLSSRFDTVTAGNVLIHVVVPDGVAMDDVMVTRNREDVTAAFQRDDLARTLTGLVDGLALGQNRLVATSKDRHHRHRSAHLTLVNHPKEGPVFSGPHQTPFACEAHNFTVPVIGVKLAATTEPECTVPTRVDYFYRTTANTFRAWPAGATSYPADMVTTTITLGTDTPYQVPYIVRMETGSANRAIYHIWILHDPLTEPEPSFHTRPRGWNGRFFYAFAPGCVGTTDQPGGWYHQGTHAGVTSSPTSATLVPAADFPLSRGYGTAAASLTVGNNNCNDVLSAETMMMIKERFIEAFGPPRFTLGFGLSGGAIQQHLIAENYPGLLDGIVPGGSFPDAMFSSRGQPADAALLHNYFTRLASSPWTDEEERAVTGFGLLATLTGPEILPLNPAPPPERLLVQDPRAFCPNTLPAADRYRPATDGDPGNPDGVRGDIFSAYRNVLGIDPETGFVRRPIDNVGVQYGLGALNAGAITVEQFLDLNEKIGGFDDDANFVPERTIADRIALRRAYRTGRIIHGGGGLASIPIIDYRAYSDDQMNEAVTPPIPVGDNHLRYFSFAMRERLIKANGHADNQVMLVDDLRDQAGATKGRVNLYTSIRSPLLAFAFAQMDRWLENLAQQDTSHDPQIDKIRRAKPAELQEGCKVRGLSQEFIPETQTRDPTSVCGALYPVNSFPRGVAGERLASDIIKCRRKRIDFGDYQVPFTPEQRARLKTIFAAGVCDWSRPGVGQRPPKGTWLSFDDIASHGHGDQHDDRDDDD